MQSAESIFNVDWFDSDIDGDFNFSCVHPDGVFNFTFKWFNDRWNAWAELPSGEIRAFGVLPNVVSWTGFTDYSIFFSTDLSVIDKDSLKNTQLCIIKWE